MTQIKIHFIVNKQAGSGKGAVVFNKATKLLNKNKITFTSYFSEYPGHEKILVEQLRKNILTPWRSNFKGVFPLLVVIGGDGTLHEVINALQDAPDIPVGYLPGGSGNDFARGSGISLSVKTAIKQLIYTNEPKSLAILETTLPNTSAKQVIINNVGIGVEAVIVDLANESIKKEVLNKIGLSKLVYLGAAYAATKKQGEFQVEIDIDDKILTFNKAFLCTTTNHPYFGGGVAIDPSASVDSQDIHLIVVEKITGITLLKLISKLLRRKHLNSSHVHLIKGNKLSIEIKRPQTTQIDGQIIAPSPGKLNISTNQRLFWIK